ncbi:MAG TPA: MarR family transcriptional regulator [Labilithrix sp.]|nr:MarR family transcriptional regulator [Labilithrix sp.]
MSDPLLLDNQLCFALHAASRAMTGAYQPLLDELGVTYPQYLVLLTLWEEDGARVSRLGERLHLDSGTLTPLLKRLESRKLVERRRSAEDERVVEVFLTAAGRRLKRSARDVPVAMLCKAGLSVPELEKLRATLQSLTHKLRDGTR